MVINSKKISRFSRCALRPTLCAFLREIGCKTPGILQCQALSTTLAYSVLCLGQDFWGTQVSLSLNFRVHLQILVDTPNLSKLYLLN